MRKIIFLIALLVTGCETAQEKECRENMDKALHMIKEYGEMVDTYKILLDERKARVADLEKQLKEKSNVF